MFSASWTGIFLMLSAEWKYQRITGKPVPSEYPRLWTGALTEMMNRGRNVPGGACGFWGACGAGISTGMFVSIISQSTPPTNEPFALSHKMTAKSLQAISEIGGPRCCKRDSFLSILAAIDFVREQVGVEMEKPEVVCHYSAQNNQCIGKRCPFSKVNH